MTTPTTTREAETYLADVRDHLDDLREEERAELLQDLAQHLADLGTDESNSDKDIRQLLGSPAAYAAELRSAAGLPPREPKVTDTKSRPQLLDRLAPFLNHRWVRPVRELASDLAPAWWVARGYLVAVIPFWLDPYRASTEDFPIPRYGGSAALGALAIVVSAAASVAIGRWGKSSLRPGRTVGLVALNAVVVLAALNGYASIRAHYRILSASNLAQLSQLSQQIGSLSTSLETPHGTVTNIYPYDAQGNPLENVLLFDQDGRPLRAGKQEWWKDGCSRAPLHPLAADGVPVEFSYPYRYGVTGQTRQGAQQDFMERAMAERTGQDPGPMQGCLPEIPRPEVPIPVFPPPAPQPEGAPAP